MLKYFSYLGYIFKHKWLVLIECFKFGIFWRGITHDFSKFSRKEFFSYGRKFFGDGIARDFPYAWAHHVHKNDHHWNYWLDPDTGSPLEMPLAATKEMLADWIAMGKNLGNSASNYYLTNRQKIRLAPNTRKFVEEYLGVSQFVNAETVIYKQN